MLIARMRLERDHQGLLVFHVSNGFHHLTRLQFQSTDHVHFMLKRTLSTLQ